MKPFVYRIMFVLSLLTLGFFSGQATDLGIGDIAFTGYNSDRLLTPIDREDEFTFVLLKDIDAGTKINFTDNGWLPSNAFATTEGTLTIDFGSAQSCGDEFRIIHYLAGGWQFFNRTGGTAGTITLNGNFSLSSSGDQIFAYYGAIPTSGTASSTTSSWIAAIQMNCAAGCTETAWDGSTTGTIESAKPSIFNTGDYSVFGIVSGTETDNAKYGCSLTSGTPDALRTAINNENNWSYDNTFIAGIADFCPVALTCATACTAPVIASLTTNSSIGSNTFCPGDNVIITVNGTANDATIWNLYSGSCGGTPFVSAIPVSSNTFSFTATSTITLYVGGTGGCVATPTCTPITITVNGLTANAGNDQKVSGSTTANISGNGAGTWSIIGVGDGNGLFAGNTTTSTTPTTTFTGTAGQEYKLRWTVNNAGCPSSSDDIVVTFLSQTILGLGDIAFTGLNADNPDEFTFVLLKDINAGTEITFTDKGWLSTNEFRVGEDAITFQICRPYACGDEFKVAGTSITDESPISAGTVVSGSALALAVGGDQIFAYQGAAPTTGNAANWIAAIHTKGPWLTAGTVGTLESYKPSAFTDGTNSISFASIVQNAKYSCAITTNSPANLAAAINNNSNWSTSSNPINLSFCGFTCGSCVEPDLMASDVTAPATACPGQTVALTINGTLNGANEWAIYTGSCGGTLVGTTTSSSFNVTPTATTTYYVSGRGGCVVSESCQTASITINSLQADAGPDQKVRNSNPGLGTSTLLAANGSVGDGTWTFVDPGDGNGNISIPDDPNTTFAGYYGQSYTLKWMIDNPDPCADTEDEVTIAFMQETTLSIGDIAFISYSADEDDFAFVILKDINAGTTIKFTDQGWQAAGGFAGNEGTITVEFCRPYSCGDEFNIFDATQEIKDASGQIAGDLTGTQLDLSTSGDQIFAYQGNQPTAGNETAFVAAIQMNGTWQTTGAVGTVESYKPSVFTDGVNSISISPERDNANLNCSAGVSAVASQINTASNWESDENNSADLPLNCNLACCTPGVVNSINGYVGPALCPSSTQTLSVNGSLNDDQEWVWYTGSCGGTEIKRGGASINVSPNVTTTYYVRAEGTCSGTSGTCVSFTVEIGDIEDPVVTCPGTINVNNDPGLCSAVVNFAATATDNCDGTVDITYSQDSGTAFDVGATRVNVTATDDFNNTDTCSFLVIVADNEGPVVDCKDFSIDLDDNGEFTLSLSFVANNAYNSRSDNCALNTDLINISGPRTYTCTEVGEHIRTIKTWDIYDNPTNCQVTVTVNDPLLVCNQPPVAKCKNITVSASFNACETTIDPLQVNNGSYDPDGDIIQLTLDNSGPFTVGGPYTVELTVSDGNLNDKCTAMVTVTDDQAPTITCPANISVNNDAGNCSAVVNIPDPTLGDNCPNPTFVYSPTSGSTFNVGTTVVTGTVTDASDNTAQCTVNVTVNDTEAPTFSNCPGNISVSNDAGECGAAVSWTPPTFEDNCEDGATSSSTYDPGDFFEVGTTTVTYSGSDAADNDATDCSFTVTVNDTEAPTFSNCPGNISVSNDAGECGAAVSWTPPTFEDNCEDGATSSSTYDPGDFFEVGTTTVTYSGSDAADNDAADCSFTVTVNDTEVPTFSNCPGNINVFNDEGDCGAIVSWTPPALNDNCPGATFDSSHDPDDFFSVGTTTVTYTGSDDADNDAIDCSFTVSVTDNEKPNISCPANISTGTDVGECGAEVTFTPAIANDNCAVEEIKARYRSVDESNSATSSWTSRVLDPSGFFPVGRYQIQWRAEDIYGNKRSCSHYLDVYDDEDPVAVCKDVTVDFNGEEDINLTVGQVWNESASSDNCGNVSYVGTSPGLSIDCDDLGNTVALTVTIEDEAGNKDQCTSYVDIIGLPCGWAEGPQDGSLNCGNDTSSDYDVHDESFSLTADGCWHDCLESDKAAFVYHELCGDGQLTARLADINTSGYAGLMARESLDPDARRAGVLKNYSTRRVRREYRAAYGGVVSQRPSNRSRVEWLRIVRQGNSIKSYTSTNGSYWRLLYKVTFPGLEDCIYFGMTAYSLNGSAEVEAVFDNVSISSSGSLAGGFGDETTAPGQFLAYDIAGNIGEGELNIFPNPASHETQIVLNGFEDKPAQIVIRDQFGRLVRQLEVDSAVGLSETIAVNDLAAGIYLVSIIQDQQAVVSKKLVVQQ